jgi:hypothetical protein
MPGLTGIPLPITAIYAAAMVAISIWLGFAVGSMRGRVGISILHGDNMELAEKMRRHGNFTENVPLALVLMAIIELNGAPPMLLHGCGVVLIAARIAHPLGLHADNMRHPARAAGAGGTLLVTVVMAGTAIWQVVT